MVRVIAPSRLHFGLFRLPSEPNGLLQGNESLVLAERYFGGVGLMIDKPGIQVEVAPAQVWSATGPLADRALAYAQTFARNCPEFETQAFTIDVIQTAPEHVGLGTGTQLGLAVARAIALAMGKPEWDAPFLAGRIGRGLRSGIGVHGFQRGGFLVDGGKKAGTSLAPLIVRHAFPDEWAILLILPRDSQGVHGLQEHEAFAHLAKSDNPSHNTDELCRLLLLGMLPALVEKDLFAFGEALFEFNRRVGEMFKPWQKGTYSSPRTAEIVEYFRKKNVHGVGQSSWGPAVFAIDMATRVTQLANQFTEELSSGGEEVLICRANGGGARKG
jgi:beta-ribofuranosylaminobenzene 5'-phosphate synthase